MAASPIFLLLIGFLGAVSADPAPTSFSFRGFGRDPAPIALFGESRVAAGGSAIELSGQAVYEVPVRLVRGNPQSLASFSTNFTFSLSGDGSGGDGGFALAMAPVGVSSNLSGNGRFGLNASAVDGLLAVEFDAAKNRVAIDSGRVKARNVSSLNLVLNSGQRLQSWIDYDAGSRMLEVRLGKAGSSSRPLDPFLSHRVDLWKMWKDRDVFLGLSTSSSSNSKQPSCLIHSWSFQLRVFPHWLHSQPLDPDAAVVSKEDAKPLKVPREKSDCLLKVLAAMIFGTGSGALGAFCILYLWTIFGNRRPVAPEEFVGKEKAPPGAADGCEYQKVELVVVDKAVKDGR